MAEIKISGKEWNSIGDPDKKKITDMMQQLKLIDKSDSFVGDAGARSAAQPLSNPFCIVACDVAEGAAVAACSALSGPLIPVCIAAAHAAADLCRSRC